MLVFVTIATTDYWHDRQNENCIVLCIPELKIIHVQFESGLLFDQSLEK